LRLIWTRLMGREQRAELLAAINPPDAYVTKDDERSRYRTNGIVIMRLSLGKVFVGLSLSILYSAV
jgi:hypothetical protein